MILLEKKKYVTQRLRTLNDKKLMIVTPLTFLMNKDFLFKKSLNSLVDSLIN